MTTDVHSLGRLGWDDSWAAAFEAAAPPGCTPARVLRVAARRVSAATDAGQRDAVLSARLLRDPPLGGVTSGDWVALDGESVVGVLPRRSALVRRAAGRATVAQAVAANLDLVLLAVPLGAVTGLRRLERSLAMAWSSGAMPAVLLTKSDLSPDLAADVAGARSVCGDAAVVAVSATGPGLADVRALLRPAQTSAIVGPSGAGKSTLINALIGDGSLATAKVRSDGRGRHTTTHRELVELPGGALLIDTPGMREMGLWDAADGIGSVFSDIEELASRCRFSDCAHEHEPGCAVTEAAQRDPTVLERLASLRKLQREQRHQLAMSDDHVRNESRRELRRRMRALQRMNRG